MSIFKVLDTHISSCVSSYPTILDNAANDSILRGTEFMLFSLLKIFDENDIDYIEEGIVDSGYRKEKLDYGIDAIYITASNDIVNLPEELDDYNEDTKFNIHLFQFKRGTGVEQGELLKFQNGIKKIFIDENFNEPDNLYFFNRLIIFNEIKDTSILAKLTFSFSNKFVSIYLKLVLSIQTTLESFLSFQSS